ncbi:hypothetical protein SAMD00019534_116920 [Acytostelium subglobosum LB1]|uniref:hypothetical protein n=1 Tax=Acytostelium subglobosum LB1 TaxID=1410327 RepID=UPI000644DE94|nr:hypothetical protein SAMD00019534_116920 [Acytostelium subglobosum LB1]GAM28516.1 hypothetical protein SAMD00019534_116920 [Acytostelium subglobosum LB1]|eukprot:XP_012748555.1 hypothetical protein SAMD00019534_116920 [Acytostelium subglobosum LB1]
MFVVDKAALDMRAVNDIANDTFSSKLFVDITSGRAPTMCCHSSEHVRELKFMASLIRQILRTSPGEVIEKLALDDVEGADPDIHPTKVYPVMFSGYINGYPILFCNHGDWSTSCLDGAKVVSVTANVTYNITNPTSSDEEDESPTLEKEAAKLFQFMYPASLAQFIEPTVVQWREIFMDNWNKVSKASDAQAPKSKKTPKSNPIYIETLSIDSRTITLGKGPMYIRRPDMNSKWKAQDVNYNGVFGTFVSSAELPPPLAHQCSPLPDTIMFGIIVGMLCRACSRSNYLWRWRLSLSLVSKKWHQYISTRFNDHLVIKSAKSLVDFLDHHFDRSDDGRVEPFRHHFQYHRSKITSLAVRGVDYTMILKLHKHELSSGLLGSSLQTLMACASFIEYITRFCTQLDSLTSLTITLDSDTDLPAMEKIATRLDAAMSNQNNQTRIKKLRLCMESAETDVFVRLRPFIFHPIFSDLQSLGIFIQYGEKIEFNDLFTELPKLTKLESLVFNFDREEQVLFSEPCLAYLKQASTLKKFKIDTESWV